MKTQVTSLRNIDHEMGMWLLGVGVRTVEQLKEEGVVAVYKKCKATYGEKVTLRFLWSLQAGLYDMHWNELPDDVKQSLLLQLDDRRI